MINQENMKKVDELKIGLYDHKGNLLAFRTFEKFKDADKFLKTKIFGNEIILNYIF